MGRILAIDFGRKRTGLAVSDPLQIIAGGLKTIPTAEIWNFLREYIAREEVERIVVGMPRKMNNQPSESYRYVEPFVKKLVKEYKDIPVEYMDERFTSGIAARALIEGGMKKHDRRDKKKIDTISAVLILQSYMDYLKIKGD